MKGYANDRHILNLFLSVLFLLGIGTSLYFIYSLPAGLHLTEGFQPKFLPVYIVIGLTFAFGILTIFSAMRYKKEVVVFRDRTIDAQSVNREATEQGRTTISLESVKATLQATSKDTLQTTLQVICKQLDAGQGALYVVIEDAGKRFVNLQHGYALTIGESTVIRYEFGEGLIGQVAVGGKTLYIDDVPNGYIKILSGLGSASPKYLLIVPVKKQDQAPKGVIEIASFTALSEDQRKFVEESAQLIAEKI
ncbi:GAF domain-containing protein [Pseudochryseolinea flava]|uniref:GAF domain-containing protein n=1 Tax=Pseudochryseolinea flava TaxID=2059302 RepID=A0A364XXZ2_9BACT|nr:GAF domain-containing protein [Pseudochryseolinea flava]RAV99120.1 hypothetical protein DQQ10_21230 [Pseudochryseolinea flava]